MFLFETAAAPAVDTNYIKRSGVNELLQSYRKVKI